MNFPGNLNDLLESMGYVLDRDYELGTVDGAIAITRWSPTEDGQSPWFESAPTPEQIAAYAAGPEWLAHRKHQLKTALVATLSAPMESAWITIPNSLRLYNPQLMSTANQAAHSADMQAMAAVLSTAQAAVDAATNEAQAEAAAAAVTIPDYAGPEV